LQSKQHKNETQINKYEDEKLHSCFHTWALLWIVYRKNFQKYVAIKSKMLFRDRTFQIIIIIVRFTCSSRATHTERRWATLSDSATTNIKN
jgi:hypothetical protein